MSYSGRRRALSFFLALFRHGKILGVEIGDSRDSGDDNNENS